MELDELFGAALKSVEATKNEVATPVALDTMFNTKNQNPAHKVFNVGIKNDLMQLLTKHKYDLNNQDLQFVIASFLQQLSTF